MSLDTPNLTTSELASRVMKHWPAPGHSVLFEVRNGTGYGKAEGYADALVMSLWPSRGLELIGCEFKVSRSDWLRELKDPAKAEKFYKYCHRWYLVSANGAAKVEEIPTPWGWLVAGPNGLKMMKEAKLLDPLIPDWRLIASIFRNVGAGAQGMVAASEVDKLVGARMQECWQANEDRITTIREEVQKQADKYHKLFSAVKDFEMASGVCLDTWLADEANFRAEGERYRLFREGGAETFKNQLRDMQERLDGLSATIARALE